MLEQLARDSLDKDLLVLVANQLALIGMNSIRQENILTIRRKELMKSLLLLESAQVYWILRQLKMKVSNLY